MKVITVTFKEGEDHAKASGLWQWDYGQKLQIMGLTGIECKEVHFALEYGEEALISMAEQTEDAVVTDIPDELLEAGHNIKAYLYVTDETSGETVKWIYLHVRAREKPEDYTTPADKNLLRQVLEKLDKKADGLQYSEGELQLLSGQNPIGNPVEITTGGDGNIESITNGDIDQIMEGE